MFLTHKKNSNGFYYLYLMEGKYDPVLKRSITSVVKSFGKVDDFRKNNPEEYAGLVEKYGDKKLRSKAEQEHTIRQFMSDSEKAEEKLDFLSNVKALMPQHYAHLALRRLWNEDLMMSKFFEYLLRHNNIEAKYNISEIALYFAMLKLVNPSSYREGLSISPRFLGDPMSDFTLDDVYRCLHVLAEHKDKIMKHVNKRIDELVPRQKSLVFFDCTNCYFETPYNDVYWYRKKALRVLRRQLRKEDLSLNLLSDKELNQIIDNSPVFTQMLDTIYSSLGEPLRMHGPSKEKRFDLPLVSIALVVDENAIPIDFKVFSGNEAETSTMKEAVSELKKKYGIKNAVLVADSALNGTKNLSMLVGEGFGFSVAKSALSFTEKIRETELNLNDFASIQDEAGNDTGMKYKIVDYHNVKYDRTELTADGKSTKYTVDCKMMITFSKSRYNRDITVLEDNIRRAQQAVDTLETISISTNGWKQLIILEKKETDKSEDESKDSENTDRTKKNIRPQFSISLNKDVIEKRRKCAGYAGILFHEPPGSKEQFTAKYVSSLYHQLVQIEECFRVMKDDFEIRPMYVRDKQSINGHVLLCMLSLIMARIIQRKFASDGCGLTVAQLQECLQSMKMMTLSVDGTHCIYMNSLEADKRACLRDESKEHPLGENELRGKLLNILGCPVETPMNTLDQLRKTFKIKSLNTSEYQRALMKKYYCNASS